MLGFTGNFFACDGIFEVNLELMLVFFMLIYIANSLRTESKVVIYSIKIAHYKGLNHLWLEYDSMLIDQAFFNINLGSCKTSERIV